MGYYDQDFLNYYYFMASEFAVSDRWFSPVASKSIDNRIATFTGGTTQGLVKDPGGDDHLAAQLNIQTIFNELDKAGVSWKIYYTVSQAFCLSDDDCLGGPNKYYPATDFSNLTYSFNYLHENNTGTCAAPTQPSSVVGDKTNSFCIDPITLLPSHISTRISPMERFRSFRSLSRATAITMSIRGRVSRFCKGRPRSAIVVNAFMNSPAWNDSVFFFAYDEGGGPYDHVPPVPNHSNDFTDTSLGTIPDISSIAVNPDSNPNYYPCTYTTPCPLHTAT